MTSKHLPIVEWRQEEVENINKTLQGAERKAALCQLLEQETELIASIGRHKIDSDAENRVLRIQRFLSKVRHKDLVWKTKTYWLHTVVFTWQDIVL